MDLHHPFSSSVSSSSSSSFFSFVRANSRTKHKEMMMYSSVKKETNLFPFSRSTVHVCAIFPRIFTVRGYDIVFRR